MLRLTKVLMAGAAVMALAACGAAEVASPGEGDFGGGGGGGGGGGPTPLPPGTPAPDCPVGLANVGTVAGGTLRACQLPAILNGALTLSVRAGTIYQISGITQVGTDRGPDPLNPLAGSVQGILTVEPGVRIFASGGADYLLINRGSQIFAEGTATNPIIFTSRQDVEGTNTATSQGQWGGIVINGRAPIANGCPVGVVAPSDQCVAFTEGTSALHGGNTPADNSGRLSFFQVKYSGFVASNNIEIQSLTLAGVGSGTFISHFQSYNSSDDGIEIFGGNVNLRRLVIMGADDDGLDTDTGWRGGAQFGIVLQDLATGNGSRGFEWSAAPTGTALATRRVSQPKVSNFTVAGRNSAATNDNPILLNSGTDSTIFNSVFTNVSTSASACLDIEQTDTLTSTPTFSSVFMSCTTAFTDDGAAPPAGDDVGAVATAAAFAGANNTSNGVSTLTAPAGATATGNGFNLNFINGANENAVPFTPIAPLNTALAPAGQTFFQTVTYIGAVQNAADTWYLGWTCGLQAGSTC